jgi:ABC-type polar amino acid transport system ATPase subunit
LNEIRLCRTPRTTVLMVTHEMRFSVKQQEMTWSFLRAVPQQ